MQESPSSERNNKKTLPIMEQEGSLLRLQDSCPEQD